MTNCVSNHDCQLRFVSLADALIAASRIVQTLCRLLFFICLYTFLLVPQPNSPHISKITAACMVLSLYVIYSVLINSSRAKVYDQLKDLVSYTVILFALTPVVRSLAETVSTDTIYALSTILSLLHVFTADYSGSEDSPVSLSLNSQIFSSVCLSSRLDKDDKVFNLLCSAAVMFVLLPKFTACIEARSLRAYMGVTAMHVITCMNLASRINLGLALVALSVLFIVGLVMPSLYVHLQRYKRCYSGPWDEAIIPQRSSN